jgi:hypothetical protein
MPLVVALVLDARRNPSPEHLTALCCLFGFAVMPSSLFGVVNIGERLLLPGLLLALVAAPDPWRLRRFGAAMAALAPAMGVYFLLIMPGPTKGVDIDHLAIDDSVQRFRLLFWHWPFQFRAQIAEAERSAATGDAPRLRLGFTTSLLAARPVAR